MSYRSKLEQLKTEEKLSRTDLETKEKEVVRLKEELQDFTQARWVLSEVSRITQQNFSTYVQEMVTMAIQSVFSRPFKFIMNFEIKRNKSECALTVQDGDGEPFIPKDEMGGGLLDIISIALRVVFWSLERPRSEAVFLLDEPMKFVGKGDMFHRAGKLLRDLSEKLGVQFIINTHEEELVSMSDRCWQVTHDGTRSTVTLVNINSEGISPGILRRRSAGVSRRD